MGTRFGGRTAGSFKKLAKLYVNGPEEYRGKWTAAAEAAGFPPGYSPDKTSSQAIHYLALERGEIKPKPKAAKAHAVDLTGLELPDPSDTDDSKWVALAKRLWPTWVGIASGELRASAAQKAILSDIMTRAHGKAGAERAEDPSKLDRPVIVLPALGDGKSLTICPVCLSGYTQPQGLQAQEGQ